MSAGTQETPGRLWGWPANRLLLVGLLGAAAVLWPFSGWEPWPWIYGVGVTILGGITLGAIGARDKVGPVWFIDLGVLVADAVLASYVTAWVWGIAGGLLAALFGVAGLTGRAQVPRWVWLTAMILGPALLITCTAIYTAGEIQFRRQQDQLAAQSRVEQLAKLRPSPRGGVFLLVEAIGFQQKTDAACFLFTPEAADQFARAHGATTCVQAIANMNKQVTNRSTYVNYLWVPEAADRQVDQVTVEMDACHLEFGNFIAGDFTGVGPQVGYMTFVQQYGAGSIITSYRDCSG